MEIQDKADQEFHRVREYWWYKSEVKDGFRNKKSDQIDAMIYGFEQQTGTVMYKRQKRRLFDKDYFMLWKAFPCLNTSSLKFLNDLNLIRALDFSFSLVKVSIDT